MYTRMDHIVDHESKYSLPRYEHEYHISPLYKYTRSSRAKSEKCPRHLGKIHIYLRIKDKL